MVVLLALLVAHTQTSCPVTSCDVSILVKDLTETVTSSPYAGNHVMTISWPTGSFATGQALKIYLGTLDTNGNCVAERLLTAVFANTNIPILEEDSSNTGSFRWDIYNANYDTNQDYYIVVREDPIADTVCDTNYEISASFRLKPSLFTWAWPGQNQVLTPGETYHIKIENFDFSPYRFGYQLDLYATLDGVEWKQVTPFGRTQWTNEYCSENNIRTMSQ